MRRLLLVSCAVGLLWPAAAEAQPTGRLLVSLRPDARAAPVAGVQATGRDVPEVGLRVVRPRAGESLRAAARRLRTDPRVRAVDIEHRAHERLIPDDPGLHLVDPVPQADGETLQWWAVRENFPAAWAIADGDSVAVAVIDQGVDATHPDLAPKIRRAIDRDGDRRHGSPRVDESGHGTHVASLVCGQPGNGTGIAGAGYGCGLIVVRSDLSDSSLVDSIVAATKAGASVITMSIGTDDRADPPRAIRDAIDYAYARGVVMVAAAADHPTTEQGDPANLLQPTGTGRFLDVGKGLSVTAADFRGGKAGFAGDGSQISVAAYGSFDRDGPDGVIGAFPTSAARPRIEIGAPVGKPCLCRSGLLGDDRYAFLEGTSMATPIVAGAAALVRDLNPDLGPGDVIKVIKQTAQRAPRSGWNQQLGWGIVDALAAVKRAARLDRRPPTSTVTAPAQASGDSVVVAVQAEDPLGPPYVRVAGLRSVRVYAAKDGGQAQQVGELAGSGELRVDVQPGHHYAFSSSAIDRAGNAETVPGRADATTDVAAA